MKKKKQGSNPSSKAVYPESILIAFHRLIQSAIRGEDVLLLEIGDKCASRGLQEYNDANFEDEDDPDLVYRQFVDRMAERFDKHHTAGKVQAPKIPGDQEKKIAEQLLNMLLRR